MTTDSKPEGSVENGQPARPPQGRPTPRLFRFLSNEELVISTAASLIALCALAVSLWQGLETRKAARIAATPYLIFDWRIRENMPYALRLMNQGLGPAIIQHSEVWVDDTFVDLPPQEVFGKVHERLGLQSFPMEGAWLVPGAVIQAGSEMLVLGVNDANYNRNTAWGVANFFNRGAVGICYCDAYRRCRGAVTGGHQFLVQTCRADYDFQLFGTPP